VSKWAALKWLKEQAALNPADASLTSGNQRYAIGDHVKIELQGAKNPHSPCSICRQTATSSSSFRSRQGNYRGFLTRQIIAEAKDKLAEGQKEKAEPGKGTAAAPAPGQILSRTGHQASGQIAYKIGARDAATLAVTASEPEVSLTWVITKTALQAGSDCIRDQTAPGIRAQGSN
jgi:hypothetical protein